MVARLVLKDRSSVFTAFEKPSCQPFVLQKTPSSLSDLGVGGAEAESIVITIGALEEFVVGEKHVELDC